MAVRAVVVIDDLREFEIRPREVFKSYVELLSLDVIKFFGDSSQLVDIPCPACKHRGRRPAFERFGLRYLECQQCLTVYLSPRPLPSALSAYYLYGESAKFWDQVLMKETDKGRREHVFGRRLDWLTDVADQFLPRPRTLLDWKSKYVSFLEELHKGVAFDSIVVAQPTTEVREACGKLGIQVAEEQDVPSGASVVSAFEVLEREFEPEVFLQDVHGRLRPGGLLLLTTRSISGFDLQVLWEKAKNILPPSHINMFSIEALQQILRNSGFEVLEFSTPGQLDVEIVWNSLQEDPDISVPRFVSYLLRQRTPEAHHALQEFLQRYRLSSHVRVLCRKR